jgi:hypothetical protein
VQGLFFGKEGKWAAQTLVKDLPIGSLERLVGRLRGGELVSRNAFSELGRELLLHEQGPKGWVVGIKWISRFRSLGSSTNIFMSYRSAQTERDTFWLPDYKITSASIRQVLSVFSMWLNR